MTLDTDRDPFTLKKRREALRMTQQNLASALGIASGTVNNWENRHTKISLKNLGKLEALERSKRVKGPKAKPIGKTLARKLAMGTAALVTYKSDNGRLTITREEAESRVASGKQVWACSDLRGAEHWGKNGAFEFTGEKCDNIALVVQARPDMPDDY